ncbi:hypothetical protein BSKO_10761 [Bryopsis sp. KO-2023]|nr:hypothetical protein BSKO_10761 [Bryopsis sp. KO-2023]
MSNSQTPSEGGDVTVGRFGQSLGAGALRDPLKAGHHEGNVFPARPPGLNMLSMPGMDPAFRADLKNRGCPFYGAPGMFPGGVSKPGPVPYGAPLPSDGTIGYRYRHNPPFVPRGLEAEKAEERSAGCVVDPELLEAAKRCIGSYREDGPRIAFDFDELPDATKSSGKASNGPQKNGQGDVDAGKTLPRPPPFGPSSWGFMFPPHLHGAHSMYHPRMWAPDGRDRSFGYPNPARKGSKSVPNGFNGAKNNPSPDSEPAGNSGSAEWNAHRAGGEAAGGLLGRKHPMLMLPSRPNGVTDDTDLEMQKLVMDKMSKLDASAQMAMVNSKNEGADIQKLLGIELPEFPILGQSQPPQPFHGIAGEEGVLGELLMVWAFVHSFSDILGLWPCAIDELVAAFLEGQRSRLLGEVHIGLLRLLMAEMEEAHISGTEKVASHIDKATLSSAQTLEEAWAWGFDVDIWRAHLNAVTWPEILRQFCIAAGLGPARPKPKREARPKIGSEGEDVVQDSNGAGLNLRIPSRFSPGSVKAAAWMVLSEAGPEGLTVQEIARRIQKKGLRDLSTSKTPEASVVGGLSRDVVFCRVAPATYALQSIISHHRQLLTSTRSQQKKERKGAKYNTDQAGSQELVEEPATEGRRSSLAKHSTNAAHESDQSRRTSARGSLEVEEKSCKSLPQESSRGGERRSVANDTDTNETCASESGQKRSWISRLLTEEYDDLSFRERMDALCALCNMATDGPSVRSKLDSRQDEHQRLRKKLQEDTRAARHQTPSKGREVLEATQSSQDKKQDETKKKDPPQWQPRKKQACTPNMRLEPLGTDRRHNRYWMFCDGSDASKGRIFLESFSDKTIQVIHNGSQLDDLKKVLEPRGVREGALLDKINKAEESIRGAMQRRGCSKLDDADDREEGVKRRKTEDTSCSPNGSWTSNEWLASVRPLAEKMVSDSSSCDVGSACGTSKRENGAEAMPPSKLDLIVKFRKDLLWVEHAIPEEVYIGGEAWSGDDWRGKVSEALNPTELRSCLEELEGTIGQGRLAPGFIRRPMLISGAWSEIDQEAAGGSELSWLPCTMPSLFLRMLAVDAALIYKEGHPPGRETLHAYNYIQRPTAPGLLESVKSELPPCNATPANEAGLETSACGSGGTVVEEGSREAAAAQQLENRIPEKDDANCH